MTQCYRAVIKLTSLTVHTVHTQGDIEVVTERYLSDKIRILLGNTEYLEQQTACEWCFMEREWETKVKHWWGTSPTTKSIRTGPAMERRLGTERK